MLVQFDDSVDIDLGRSILIGTSIRGKVLSIDGSFLTQPLQQPPFHFRFRDQRFKGVSIRVLNVWDKSGRVRDELRLRDEFP